MNSEVLEFQREYVDGRCSECAAVLSENSAVRKPHIAGQLEKDDVIKDPKDGGDIRRVLEHAKSCGGCLVQWFVISAIVNLERH